MNIGEASKISGVSTKMMRYYETIGLVSAPQRTEAGYRIYSASDVQTLGFISRARDLGFSVEQIAVLLELWRDRSRASVEVKDLALEHIRVLEEKARAVSAMSATLKHLADNCHGDMRPDCPIIEDLVGPADAEPKRRKPRFGVVADLAPGRARTTRH